MGKKARSRNARTHDENIINMNYHNQQAMINGPQKKSWNIHDLQPITPLNEKQKDMFHSWFQGDNLCAHGSAGTGKTFLSLYLAFDEMLDYKEHHQIIIVRSAVASRDIGHLPGSKEEKEEIFKLPYIDICAELFGRKSTFADMEEANIVKFMTTSHIRGITLDNSIIIVDEIQNMQAEEINSIMTRVGRNTRVILCGDSKAQCDLKRHETTGVHNLLKIVERIDAFSSIEFEHSDIVRSEFCKNWIIASNDVARDS